MAHARNNLFDYTYGRWLINDVLRHAERRHAFSVDGLRRLAAQSVDRSPDDIVDLVKLAEGGFNRTFLITMRDGFQMVAPTMTFLRSSGLPIPKVYGYSPTPDNAAETEYIFMEFVQGTKLSSVWPDLEDQEINSVLRPLVHLESKMMSVTFPACTMPKTYREKVTRRPGVPLEDKRFCVGPDTRLPLWFGRRSQLDVDRGPYDSVEAALAVAGARKELAYLEQFGQPLLPFRRMRREAYRYQEQLPSDHIENLHRYLLIAPSLVPKNPALVHFRIRHPDLQQSNIIVSRSPDSKWQVVGLIDWQHASIPPVFLLAGVPQRLQNYSDPFSHFMTPPSLPENFDDFYETEQSRAKGLYHRRLVHYYYVKNTEECNKLHFTALTEPAGVLRRRLFTHASDPWEGETLALKVALIQASEKWKTMKLDAEQNEADEMLEVLQNMLGVGPEGWMPTEHYEEAVTRTRQLKEEALAAAETAEERAEVATHWPFDDMDEEKYM
ncbi:protein kinase subdomain-containing protein PKL/CAK/Fmp29 [Lentinus brumalis]|uniref:Protein kinase subdomain-containing protein PKL/CAK/Fmp29 n=1 Tax=Lentinus brumalis TaxID=2498619 RepID=A0A371CWF5_9APHY|nr:protein kinase subdomain-containing protein PKL/CAK/Fmp29 [Polyporus brumalis]